MIRTVNDGHEVISPLSLSLSLSLQGLTLAAPLSSSAVLRITRFSNRNSCYLLHQIMDSTAVSSMISALCWVPKGACKYQPVEAEQPSKEEIEEVIRSGALRRRGAADDDEEEGENEDMDEDDSGTVDEVAKALAAAQALGGTRGDGISSGVLHDISDGLRELNMDQYDEEDDGIELFSSGLGDAYYPSNKLDPYLLDPDDEDEDEIEDLTIKPTDGIIVCAHNEDDANQLEILVLEDPDDAETNMYSHHEILLSAFPLCLAWLDCNLRSGDNDGKGNFIAVGTFDPAIEIWDLDILDEAEPFKVLGGTVTKKSKGKKVVKYKKDSHKDSVLGLAWNKDIMNVLASASADKSVKVWNIVTGQCVHTLKHHSDKVQAVAWNRCSPQVLLSGSFDHSVVMVDMLSNAHVANRWSVAADVESLAWDPHSEYAFVVSLENGTVQGFDTRMVTKDSSSTSNPTFTLHAHDKAVCSVAYNPVAANLLATGSSDKTVKLWDISNNQPSCLASKNLKAGAVFSLAFYEDSPFMLAVGGAKGKLRLWDTTKESGVANKFRKLNSNGKTTVLEG